MVIDTSKPHLGRIYDFMLGGHNNYEVDRQAAAQILKAAPTYPKWARANRWFLQYVADEWARAGHERVLDLGSGLPTRGHLNDALPDARVLFTDNDPLTVAHGGDLLAGRPNMRYRLADVARPEVVVAHAEEFFAGQRVVAISCIGIAYLVSDAVLSGVLRALHAWSAPGSVLALSFGTFVENGDQVQMASAIAAFRRHGNATLQLRTTEELLALASPWRATSVRPLTQWLDVPDMFSPEELASQGGSMSGAFFER